MLSPICRSFDILSIKLAQCKPLLVKPIPSRHSAAAFEKDFEMLERPRHLLTESEGGADDVNLDVPLTQVAWQRIRDDIICGKLRPNARLRIGKLRDLYGIGASPLREALSRLVPDGFVN